MKRTFKILPGVFSICLFAVTALAGSYKLEYKMAPGQNWLATFSTEKKSESAEGKDFSQVNAIVEYKVSEGPEKNWISLTARIKSQDHPIGNKNTMPKDLSKIEYVADMHRSGKIKNAKFSGNVLPHLDDKIKKYSPEKVDRYEQSSQIIAEAWKNTVFWFPDLPEDAMKPGDKFEVTKKMDMGKEAIGMNMQAVFKQVFTLKDVRDGLAFFIVKGYTTTNSTDEKLGESRTVTEGDGEAVFNIREGMWTDFTIKNQSKVHFSNVRHKSEKFQDVYQISRIHMEKQ
ncbi:MAG: hypothetical protein ACMUIU_18135 [bacterium]